ncbi:hypothetical protein DL764_009875 [Monosporascus ibericus]|uniref:Uncharacterized protein n=1 Tax=Monosporascus ibericus TaxID=155417 RepID=A0A4Q4SVV6_9PEZI|nr:hypothetical protein DL764_009875 [Monosporascus ibericus]
MATDHRTLLGYWRDWTLRSEASAKKVISYFLENAAQLSSVTVPDTTKMEPYEDAPDGMTGIVHTGIRWGPSVTRVLVTSWFASIFDLGQGARAGHTYDEEVWNSITYEEAPKTHGVTAYCASKALTETASYVHELKDTKHLSESLALMWAIAGTKKIPPFDFGGCADLRDVAAHSLALDAQEATWNQLAALDGSKSSKVLGLTYWTLAETVTDMYDQLLNSS